MVNENRIPERGERLEDPPEGLDSGFSELIWNLREWGFPITGDSVILVLNYLDERNLEPHEVSYKVVAQSIEQNNPEFEFDTNNEVTGRELLENEGVDTNHLSDVGVQLVLEDFKSEKY